MDIPENEFDIISLYGTTTIGIASCNFGTFFFQLGDGEIFTISNNEIKKAFPKQTQIIDFQTDSLCQPNAHLKAQTNFVFPNTTTPFIFACTDGFSNSFSNDNELFNTVLAYKELAQTHSPDFIGQNLPRWLQETSQTGSGDDISIGILWH